MDDADDIPQEVVDKWAASFAETGLPVEQVESWLTEQLQDEEAYEAAYDHAAESFPQGGRDMLAGMRPQKSKELRNVIKALRF